MFRISTADANESRQHCLGCHPAHLSEQGSCTSCHSGNPLSDRKDIAHHRVVAGRYARYTLEGDPVGSEGRRLVDRFACRRCHVTNGTGNRLATPLDSIPTMKTPEEIAAAIRTPMYGMPDFRVPEDQITALVNGILWGARQQPKPPVQLPLLLHFSGEEQGAKNLFTRKCGSCHTALTRNHGMSGGGNIGPNLSGIFSEWYPNRSGGRSGWSAHRLRRWLDNPRETLPTGRMQPVNLSAGEFGVVIDTLSLSRNNNN